jgi:hypothetical protein
MGLNLYLYSLAVLFYLLLGLCLGFFIFHEKDYIFHTHAPFSINQQLTGGALATIGIDTL